MSTAHYPDDRDRLTVTRARHRATPCRSIFCPLGMVPCPFDPKRVVRLLDHARRSSSRARSTVLELARCNSLDHLLTLTAGTHLGSRTEALDAFSAFIADRHHGRWFGAHVGSYVAVAEPFDTGGWHVHVGIRGRLRPSMLLRLKESWTSFLASVLGIPKPSSGGFWRVNVAPPTHACSSATLGAYLSKHLDTSSKGQRSYRCAVGMARALKEGFVVLLTAAAAWALVACFGRPRRIIHPLCATVLGWTSEGRGAQRYLSSIGLKEVTW